MDRLREIADAVLYEGYILWPYRASAIKNQRRWTFGGIYPKRHSTHGGTGDPWTMQTQCLILTGPGTTVDVRVRFLHVVSREVARRTADGLERVDELRVAGRRHMSWDEAVEREIAATGLRPAQLQGCLAPVPGTGARHRPGHVVPISIDAGTSEEVLTGEDGEPAGVIMRAHRALRGEVAIAAEALADGLVKLSVRIANTTPWKGTDREDALRQTFCSAHTVVEAIRGELVSLMDPPEQLRPFAEACENVGTWPVLVGEPGEHHTILSSPIILYDYPQIAPESPGDLFDGTEIDQMLVLNILSMTEEEQEEMAASDPRAGEILERCRALSPEDIMRLHGAIRQFGPAMPR
jgi:hypothetical protein